MISRCSAQFFSGCTLIFCLLLLSPVLAQNQQASSSTPAAEESYAARLEIVVNNLASELARAKKSLQRERAALNELELNKRRQTVTANQLEQARLDTASLNSQRNSLTTRLLSRKEALREIEAEIERVEDRINDGIGDAETLRSRKAELESQERGVGEVIDALNELQRTLNNRLSLARQQLAVLQNRFELPELNTITTAPSPREVQLRRKIDQQLAKASALRTQAADKSDAIAALRDARSSNQAVDTSDLNDEQRWLALQAQVAEERAELQQQSLKLLRATQIMQVLRDFPQSPSTPLRVLRNGIENIDALCASLQEQIELLDRRQNLLSGQIRLNQQQLNIASNQTPELQAKKAAITTAREVVRGLDEQQQQAKAAAKAALEEAEKSASSEPGEKTPAEVAARAAAVAAAKQLADSKADAIAKVEQLQADYDQALIDSSEQLSLLTDLSSQATEQLSAYKAAEQQAEAIASDYKRVIGERSQTALLERNNWPTDRYSWGSLAASLTKLPGRVARDFVGAARRLVRGFNRVLSGEQLLPGFAALGTLLVGLLGYRWLRNFEPAHPIDAEAVELGRSLREPLKILRRNYFLLMLPLAMAIIGWMLRLNFKSLTLLVTPLLIWPVVTVSIAFTRYFLRTYTPDIDRDTTTRLLREASWVIGFTAVLAGCLTIARTVALSPLVTSAIEGLSMFCLLIIALPLVHLRKQLVGKGRQQFWQANDKLSRAAALRRRALSVGTGILTFTLVGCAIIGIVGYVNLAWSIVRYVAVGVLVILVWLTLRTLLRDAIDAWNARIEERDPTSAAFWRQCVLAPLYGVLVIILTVAAGWLVFWLFGWNAETPIVRVMPKIFNYTLFSVGETKIELSNFFIAALIVFMVFRAASWSRQVSYRFALQKVQDVGIRNSLSTFVQYSVVVAGLIIAMRTIGLNLTALSVFAGALGVGIGFGLQQIVVNFISGILLLIERPLATTDLVNVDKYEGEVTHIGIRSLTVKTWDAQEVIIPNSAVITKPFTNWTRSDDTMRTVLLLGISYDDDPKKAIELITDIVTKHPAVLSAPAPKILLWEYADSALIIRVQLFSRIRGEIGRVDMRSQLLLSIREGLMEAGMSIPYPQRDLHIIKADD